MNNELTYEDVEGEVAELLGPEAVRVKEPKQEVYVHPMEIMLEYVRNLVPGITVTDRGLELPQDVEFSQVENLAELFESTHASIPLLWGDLINEAERKFQTEWTQILSNRIGKAEGTVRNWRYVCNSIPQDLRPDPRIVRISKLYHIAGLTTTSMKRTLIEMAEDEGLDTKTVQAVCDLLKLWPEEERETMEDYYVGVLSRTHMDHQEFMVELRNDLIREGIMEDPDAEDDLDPHEKAQKTGEETAEDLVAKLLDLAESAGSNVPQNVLALFASTIELSKVLAFSQDAQAVQDSFYTLGVVADHLARLRIAQIELGRTDVGCTCDQEDMGGLAQYDDCPVHGGGLSEAEEDSGQGLDTEEDSE